MRGVVDTLVVGAGVSGLAYAQARGRNADLLVLEGSDRAGGLLRTTRAKFEPGGAVQFEWGPEVLTGSAELAALMTELKLAPQPVETAALRQLVLRDGRLHPLPVGPAALLRTRMLSWRGRLRALSEPFRARDTALDGSVADFVRHRFGEEVLQNLADPLVMSIFAAAPERLSLRAAFPEWRALVAEHGSVWSARNARLLAPPSGAEPPSAFILPGGLNKFADALANSLGNRLLVNLRVTAVNQEPASFDDPWEAVSDLTRHPMVWRVDAQSHQGSQVEELSWRAKRLVLALPAKAAARVLLPVDRTLAESLASVSSESVVSLSHAWRRQDVGHALDAFGFIVPSRESQVQLGTVFSSTIRPSCCTEGLVLLRTLLGGGRNTRLIDWPEEELWGVIEQEVAPVLGLKGKPVWTSVIRQREALPRYDLEHPRRREHIGHMLKALPGLSVLGNWNRGTGCEQLIAEARVLAREHAATESHEGQNARGSRVRTP